MAPMMGVMVAEGCGGSRGDTGCRRSGGKECCGRGRGDAGGVGCGRCGGRGGGGGGGETLCNFPVILT